VNVYVTPLSIHITHTPEGINAGIKPSGFYKILKGRLPQSRITKVNRL